MNRFDEITDLRHHLHTLAERSGEERHTAAAVTDFLKGNKPDHIQEGIGGNGLIAGWKGAEPGPSVVLRCELDALPIPDEPHLSYRSEDRSTGHKCGHDGHMAILCGVARHLRDHPPVKGEVHLLFQSAEETGEGARAMLSDPRFHVTPDYIFALHNLPGYGRGEIIIREGIFSAASRGFIVRLAGATAHAAESEQGNNPAPAVAQLVQALESLPQQHLSIDRHARITIIHLRLGEPAFGTTPGEAEVMATVRTYDPDLLEELIERMEQLAEGIARTWELDLEMEQVEDFTVTRNNPEAVGIIRESARENGCEWRDKEKPFPWSEDFGRFTHRFTGAMFGLGSGVSHPPLHSGDYDFPDELLSTGISMFTAIIRKAGVECR